MIPTLIALLFLGQSDSLWLTFNCPNGGCVYNITNGTPVAEQTVKWNYLNVLCMNGPRLSSEADPKAEREFFPVCRRFDLDWDGDFDLRDWADFQEHFF